MKRLRWLFVILTFILILPFHTFAQEPTGTEATSSPVPAYTLPYPGMLPDNPLYKLKVLRDKIMLLLISDPNKKAQYHLLLANKGLVMSKLLLDKGNTALAKETALKGEHEMTLMTYIFKNANLAPPKPFLQEVERATKAHQLLLEAATQKAGPQEGKIFTTVEEFSKRNLDELRLLGQSNP